MNLYDRAKELANAIMSTKEFSELKQAKSNIDLNRELKNNVNEFMKKQMEIYASGNSFKSIEAGANELNRRFQSLSKISEVDSFLKASKNYSDMLSKIYKTINDTIDSGF